MTITINVTDKHIAVGNPTMDDSCPISLAITEQVPGARFVKVGRRGGNLTDENDCVLGLSWRSSDVTSFIHDFDNDRPVSPISFPLEIEEAA